MIQGLSISSSGLAHNEKRLNASAHNTTNLNTANLNTRGAARAHVRGEEVPGAGVQAHYFARDRDINAVEESVEQILAGHHFTANVRAA